MTIGNKIAEYRKKLGLTQDDLAQKLGVTNQAVSKWELNQCCPDIGLLPLLADVFGISIDELFDRAAKDKVIKHELPWADDNTVRAVIYVGHTLVDGHKAAEDITFTYDGPALNVSSEFSVRCGDVEGDVNAGDSVLCGNVAGSVSAGDSVECGNVEKSVTAGCNVECGSVGGEVFAGGPIHIHGSEDVQEQDVNVIYQSMGHGVPDFVKDMLRDIFGSAKDTEAQDKD